MTLFQDGRKIITPKKQAIEDQSNSSVNSWYDYQWIYLDENKSIAMRWMTIALFDGDPKRMRWRNFEFRNFGAEENVRVLSYETKTDRTKISLPRQKSHRLFLQVQNSFLCQQSFTNWVHTLDAY